jgi:carboxylesterase
MSAMHERHPIIGGAGAWSAEGRGHRARIGIGLIHGFTGSPVSMRAMAEALAERGFTVELPRLPGHGTHWTDMVETQYSDWRSEVSAAVDRLRARCDAVLLVGLSMGGALVLDVATERQHDLAGVMTINAVMTEERGVTAKLTPLLAMLIKAVPPRLAKLAKNDIAKGGDEKAYPMVPLKAAVSLLAAIPGIRAGLPSLRLPIVVAYSTHDHSVPNASSKDILAMVASTDVKELVLERSFHVATMDYDMDLLVDAAARLADRVSAVPETAA